MLWYRSNQHIKNTLRFRFQTHLYFCLPFPRSISLLLFTTQLLCYSLHLPIYITNKIKHYLLAQTGYALDIVLFWIFQNSAIFAPFENQSIFCIILYFRKDFTPFGIVQLFNSIALMCVCFRVRANIFHKCFTSAFATLHKLQKPYTLQQHTCKDCHILRTFALSLRLQRYDNIFNYKTFLQKIFKKKRIFFQGLRNSLKINKL